MFVANHAVAERTHGLSMFEDLKYPPDFTHFQYANPDAPKGGTIRIGTSGSFDSFNPFIRKGLAAPGMNLLGGLPYDSLTVSSDDEPFSQYGLIAESMELAEDKSTLTYYLNPKARFHDGKTITADDVVFSFDILKEKGNPFFQYYYAEVTKAEAIDKSTVRFHFSNQNNAELPLIMGQLPVLPKHYWENHDFSESTLTPPLSSGAYKISDFKPGRYVVYTRVQDYWAKDHPVYKGRLNFDHVRFEVYLDDSVLRQAFKAGNIDYRAENSAKAWATEYEGNALSNNWIIQEVFPTSVPIASTGMAFNLRKEKFQNRDVRRAISLAFDFEWSNKNIFYNQYLRADSFFPSSPFHIEGLPDDDELAVLEAYRNELPDYVFSQPIDIPVSDGSGWNRENLKQAQQILKDAGYRIENNRLTDENGNPFIIEFLINTPTLNRILLPFKRNLQVLGIDLILRVVDSAAYQNRMQNFDFDMTMFAAGQSLNPGNEQKEMWGSHAAETPASRNEMGIRHPVIDALIEKIIASSSREELTANVKAMNRILTQEIYMIPGFHLPARRLAYWNKFSYPKQVIPDASTIDHGADILSNWWLDEEKQKRLNEAMKNNAKIELQ